MKVIGLTGNIASGKSTVTRVLKDLGARVLDADAVVHELMAPGQPAYKAIVAEFGEGILRPDGTLDRAALGQRVFPDPAALQRLESILYPHVRAYVVAWLDQMRQAGARVAVVDAVKLLEAGFDRLCDEIWVVVARPEQQLERLVDLRRLPEADARARLAAQPPLAPKLARADVVIDNSGTIAETRRQVEAAWRRLTSSSTTR